MVEVSVNTKLNIIVISLDHFSTLEYVSHYLLTSWFFQLYLTMGLWRHIFLFCVQFIYRQMWAITEMFDHSVDHVQPTTKQHSDQLLLLNCRLSIIRFTRNVDDRWYCWHVSKARWHLVCESIYDWHAYVSRHLPHVRSTNGREKSLRAETKGKKDQFRKQNFIYR